MRNSKRCRRQQREIESKRSAQAWKLWQHSHLNSLLHRKLKCCAKTCLCDELNRLQSERRHVSIFIHFELYNVAVLVFKMA